jgi:hypothetical protein
MSNYLLGKRRVMNADRDMNGRGLDGKDVDERELGRMKVNLQVCMYKF